MARFGARNRYTAVSLSTAAVNLAGFRALGAIGFIVKVWGGSNGTDPLATLKAKPSWDGTAITTVISADGFGEALTNPVETGARPMYIPSILTGIAPIVPWPADYAVIELTLQANTSTGCTVDVWAVYQDGAGTGSPMLPTD